jgi:hypothetical protein
MEWIIVGIIGLFLLSKTSTGNISAQSSSPINQATGASLSNALGNATAHPSYYSSGNPSYNASPGDMSPPAVPTESRITAPAATPATLTPTQISNNIRAATEANPSAPRLNQPVAIRTRQTGPEISSAFWTKAPIRIVRSA